MSEANEKARLHVIAVAMTRMDIIRGDDGFFVYWPNRHVGALAPHQLRWLADELDRLNAPWQADIDQYFAEHP